MSTKQLNNLFFPARKEELLENGVSYSPKKIAVRGTPFNGPLITYDPKSKDFNFVSYHKAYLGGLCRASRLFGINASNVRVQKIDYGRRIQWALIELTQDARSVKIAGEDYQPYILIDYKYDSPTVIHYHFGVVRMACSNGIISGLKFFANQKVKTKDFKICDAFYNPCLMDILTGRYNLLFNTMKDTKVNDDQLQQVFEMMLGRSLKGNTSNKNNKMLDDIREESERDFFDSVSEKYSNMGGNMYRVLNMFTDYATHYNVNVHDEENEIPQKIVSRQQRAGEFLDELFDYFDNSNHFIIDENTESETFGRRSVNPKSEVNINSILKALSKK
jgi:hypothetical protein